MLFGQKKNVFVLLTVCVMFCLFWISSVNKTNEIIIWSGVNTCRVELYETLTNIMEKQGDFDFTQEMKILNEKRVAADDPRLVNLIRKYYITPPSTQPYDLKHPEKQDNSVGQTAFVDSKLGYKECGFFVESGAFNGETLSNTLFFERKRGWNGILVEPNPIHYKEMLNKHRKAFTINACLSTEEYPSVKLITLKTVMSKVHVDRNQSKDVLALMNRQPVQCFPLYSILLAMNRTNVDYLSLDVEGVERRVLDTVPWQEVNIEMMSVEHDKWNGGSKSLCEYMERRGYESLLTISGKSAADVILKRRRE